MTAVQTIGWSDPRATPPAPPNDNRDVIDLLEQLAARETGCGSIEAADLVANMLSLLAITPATARAFYRVARQHASTPPVAGEMRDDQSTAAQDSFQDARRRSLIMLGMR